MLKYLLTELSGGRRETTARTKRREPDKGRRRVKNE